MRPYIYVVIYCQKLQKFEELVKNGFWIIYNGCKSEPIIRLNSNNPDSHNMAQLRTMPFNLISSEALHFKTHQETNIYAVGRVISEIFLQSMGDPKV